MKYIIRFPFSVMTTSWKINYIKNILTQVMRHAFNAFSPLIETCLKFRFSHNRIIHAPLWFNILAIPLNMLTIIIFQYESNVIQFIRDNFILICFTALKNSKIISLILSDSASPAHFSWIANQICPMGLYDV
jgi:hypothetical protein